MKSILNKRNGIIAAIVIVLIIAAIVVSTSLSSAMNSEEAKEIAQKYVPETAKFINSEEEQRYFEVAFYDETNHESFEVEVNKETGEVKKVESQLANDLGSKEIKLTEDDVKKVVQDRFKGVSSVTVTLTKDNGLYEYETDFKGEGFYGDADIHAETGAVLDSVLKYGTVVTIPAGESAENELLSYEQAKDAVVKTAGGGIVRDISLDRENQDYFYEVELHLDNMEKDYIVNAKTGEVVLESEHKCYFEHHHDEDPYGETEVYVPETEKEPEAAVSSDASTENQSSSNGSGNTAADNGLISEDEAKEIVRAKIPGAEFVEFFLERDEGRYEYEGKAQLDGYEYEFEINASSGIITNWDKERIEMDDDDWDDD